MDVPRVDAGVDSIVAQHDHHFVSLSEPASGEVWAGVSSAWERALMLFYVSMTLEQLKRGVDWMRS